MRALPASVTICDSTSDGQKAWALLNLQRCPPPETPAGPVPTVATIRPEQIGGRAPIRKMVWEDLQRVMEELQ